MHNPYVEHINTAKNILRYIVGTKGISLKFTKLPSNILSRLSDFNYGNDINDRKSTSYYVFNIISCAISWYSKKKPTVTISTTEA